VCNRTLPLDISQNDTLCGPLHCARGWNLHCPPRSLCMHATLAAPCPTCQPCCSALWHRTGTLLPAATLPRHAPKAAASASRAARTQINIVNIGRPLESAATRECLSTHLPSVSATRPGMQRHARFAARGTVLPWKLSHGASVTCRLPSRLPGLQGCLHGNQLPGVLQAMPAAGHS